jgi:hypothetical protein
MHIFRSCSIWYITDRPKLRPRASTTTIAIRHHAATCSQSNRVASVPVRPRQRITAPAQFCHDWPIEGIDEAQAKRKEQARPRSNLCGGWRRRAKQHVQIDREQAECRWQDQRDQVPAQADPPLCQAAQERAQSWLAIGERSDNFVWSKLSDIADASSAAAHGSTRRRRAGADDHRPQRLTS